MANDKLHIRLNPEQKEHPRQQGKFMGKSFILSCDVRQVTSKKRPNTTDAAKRMRIGEATAMCARVFSKFRKKYAVYGLRHRTGIPHHDSIHIEISAIRKAFFEPLMRTSIGHPPISDAEFARMVAREMYTYRNETRNGRLTPVLFMSPMTVLIMGGIAKELGNKKD